MYWENVESLCFCCIKNAKKNETKKNPKPSYEYYIYQSSNRSVAPLNTNRLPKSCQLCFSSIEPNMKHDPLGVNERCCPTRSHLLTMKPFW